MLFSTLQKPLILFRDGQNYHRFTYRLTNQDTSEKVQSQWPQKCTTHLAQTETCLLQNIRHPTVHHNTRNNLTTCAYRFFYHFLSKTHRFKYPHTIISNSRKLLQYFHLSLFPLNLIYFLNSTSSKFKKFSVANGQRFSDWHGNSAEVGTLLNRRGPVKWERIVSSMCSVCSS